jgi:hypothetical protein
MKENEDQEVQIMEVNPESVYLQDKAQIDVQIATAKKYPRNIRRATDNAVAIVTMDKETASTCTYAVPRGGKSITGPSIHMAKILAQVWGNLRIEAKVIDIGDKQVTSQAVAFDLENNLAIRVEVKRSIMTKTGRMSDDMITVTGNAANSIAMRNSILSVINRAVVDKVYRAAIGTITGDISDANKFLARKKQVLDGFKDSLKVTEEMALSAIGKSSIDHITSDDLVTLIGIGQAIKDGDTTVEEAFKNTKKVGKTVQQQEDERLITLIKEASTLEVLESYKDKVKPEHQLVYDTRVQELTMLANKATKKP